MDFGMIGPAIALACGCIGSAIGCGIAGMASHGAMSQTEEGHGKFIGLSALPASQSVYGIVLTIVMADKITAKVLNPFVAVGVALFAGLALLGSAIYQGKVAATAIQATIKQPAIFGKCAASVGIIEGFALFALAFSLLII